MHCTMQIFACLLAALTFFAVSTAAEAHVEFSHGRRVLQRKGRTLEFDGKSKQSFENLLKDAKAGDTVLVSVKTLSLKKPASVEKGVTIRGGKKVKTIVECPGDTAFYLRSSNITIANFHFRNCKATPVKVENPNTGKESAKVITVLLDDLHFSGNGGPTVDGGALSVDRLCRVAILNSTFHKNEGRLGGAVFARQGTLDLNLVGFEANTAKSAGGAIAIVNNVASPLENKEQLTIQKCVFQRNQAPEGGTSSFGLNLKNGAPVEQSQFIEFEHPRANGGAVLAVGLRKVDIGSTIFNENAGGTGGALYLFENMDVEITKSTFEGNVLNGTEEFQQGGAIYAAFSSGDGGLTISASMFKMNVGGMGGALHVLSRQETTVKLVECTFENNSAAQGGGAAVVRNTVSSNWDGCSFVGNTARLGGAILFTNGAGAMIGDSVKADGPTGTVFKENKGEHGGAVLCFGTGTVTVQGGQFLGNQATKVGGGFAALNSLENADLVFTDVTFKSNIAGELGGGLFVDGVSNLRVSSSKVDGRKSLFEFNEAKTGGAIHVESGESIRNHIFIAETDFIGNQALQGIENIDSIIWNPCSIFGCIFINREKKSCGDGGGSAICIDLKENSQQLILNVELVDNAFENNSGYGEGTVNIFMEGSNWSREECPEDLPLLGESCRRVTVAGQAFTSNDDERGGRSWVRSNNPESVLLSCEQGPLQKEFLNTLTSSCPDWQ